MEEVDKVCNELRDMFIEFVDDTGDVKVQVFPRGTTTNGVNDNKYTISIGLTATHNGITRKSFNTNEIYDSVMMACEYLESFYDFDIEFKYYTPRLSHGDYNTKEFPKDIISVAFYIIFKEKIK